VLNGSSPVLFAYDGSEYARTAIEQAAHELRTDRQAIVLTVWQTFGVPLAGPPAALPEDLADEVEQENQRIADEGAELARSAGFTAVPVAIRGEPVWRQIVNAADEAGAGVIVLGSHGRSGLSAVMMGSVATAVASHTDRSVLIVHLPEAAEREAAKGSADGSP
jgi:nucleotide-binding universal stress UspA family protein